MGTLNVGPFLSLSPTLREELAAAGVATTFAAGDTLVHEGEPPGDVFLLTAGRVRVTTGDRLRTLATMSAPALVGEMAVVLDQPRNASVVAAGPVRALRLPREALASVIAAAPGFASELRAFAELRAATNFLRRDSPFADLPSEAIDELAASCSAVTFADGDAIVREGERGDDAYLLRSGEAEVVRRSAGVERHLTTLSAGAFVGEVSALTGATRSATVRATGPVSAFRINGEDVRRIVRRYRAVVTRLESAMQSKHAPRRTGAARVRAAPDDPGAVILHDSRSGTYLRLSTQGLAIYDDLDGERSLRDIAMAHAGRTGLDDPSTVYATVATLQAAGFVTMPRIASEQSDARVMRVLDLVLAPRIEIRDADRAAGALHRALRPLFSRPGAVVSVVVGVVGCGSLARTLRDASPGDFGVAGLAVAFAGLALAGVGHEAAHAIATKAEGRRVGRAGIGLMVFTPVIWVDTSDAWFIPRTHRAVVNAAGPLFNFALAGALGLLATVTSGHAQDLAIWLAVANLVSVVFNLSPLLEFDGYYVLSDLVNVNALRRKALRFVFADLIKRPRRPASRLEAGFIAFTAAAAAYVLAMTILVLSGVPTLVEGILPVFIAGQLRIAAGVAIALVMTGLLVAPFVSEVRAARVSPEPDDDALAERLEERMSKTDLTAAVSAKTSSPVLRAPSEGRR
ncbi:MAG TPA: cyclic nucleotide-binding domain-containing protein [Candidatus Limnocylindria bacterium]|nr:cyclic nucleotide-binding domain-containing protein [Candidatus Limnocylindria bacterium]